MPTITKIASTPSPARATSGSARGADLRMIPATMRICLMRPAVDGAAASFRFAAVAGLLARDGRIRAGGRLWETGGRALAGGPARGAVRTGAADLGVGPTGSRGTGWQRTGGGGAGRDPARHRLGVQP